MTIKVENIGGIWYVNHKRLGIDFITEAEYMAVKEFINLKKRKNILKQLENK